MSEPDASLVSQLVLLGSGLQNLQHDLFRGSGCACCSRGPPSFKPNMIEEDLLAFLADEYCASGESELLAIVETWIADSERRLVTKLSDGARGVEYAAPRALRRIMRDLLEVVEINTRSSRARSRMG